MISIRSHNAAKVQKPPRDTLETCPTCCQQISDNPELIIDRHGGTVLRFASLVKLTPAEMDVFWSIYRHRPHIVSAERIIIQLSSDGESLKDENYIGVQVLRINRKLKPVSLLLQNEWGRGYRAVVGSL